MLHGRRKIAKSKPAAYFKPKGFCPEHFGCQQGIPLYRYDKTRAYNPRPETIAAQQFYDFFVASQNRHRHSIYKLPFRQPMKVANNPAVEKRHDRQSAAEDECTRLQEEKKKSPDRSCRGRSLHADDTNKISHPRNRP